MTHRSLYVYIEKKSLYTNKMLCMYTELCHRCRVPIEKSDGRSKRMS